MFMIDYTLQNCFSSAYRWTHTDSGHARSPWKRPRGYDLPRRIHYTGTFILDLCVIFVSICCSISHSRPLSSQGTPALTQSNVAADLLKGTIAKLATEDLSEAHSKAHVIYAGKSGHILSYDGKSPNHLYCVFVTSVSFIYAAV